MEATIGRYEVLNELGHGGMATVYRAYDPLFKREVAVKVLPREFLHDRTFRDRFKREAETVALLEHEAIVPILDYGEDDGQPYQVMQYLPGGTLTEWLSQGPMDVDQAAVIMERIGAALDTAHFNGVIHRDVKPSNILFDQDYYAYLSDFGIVKLTEASAQFTSRGMVGTPAYMAPEMARPGGVSPLIDVYALGVTLYQILTVRLPYEAETPLGLLMAHATEPIPDIGKLRPDLPNGVQKVVRHALAKDPMQRTPSAGELAKEFQAAVKAAKPKKQRARKPEPKPEPTPAVVEMPTFDELTPPPVKEKTPARIARGEAAPPRRISPIFIGVGAILIVAVIGMLAALNGVFGSADGTPTPTQVVADTDSTDIPDGPTNTPDDGLVANPTTEPTSAVDPHILLAEQGVNSNAQWIPLEQEVDGVLMTLVPAGCFTMGSDDGDEDERPAHQVCFETPFWIDQYEVTNQQFDTLGGQAALPSDDSASDVPRGNLTWDEAAAFCETRGARLPTEAEWEYAARGPDGNLYAWGNDDVSGELAQFGGIFGTTLSFAGSKPDGVSWVRAYDLIGNAWEWVYDWYDPEYYGTLGEADINNPQGPESGQLKSMRGGTWPLTEDLRAANRNGATPDDQLRFNGVRCARDYQPGEVAISEPTPTAASAVGGEIVFVSMRDGNPEIYVMDANGSNPIRLTEHPNEDVTPEWSPDGTRIAFASTRGGTFDIYVMDSDGSNVTQLTTSNTSDTNPTWSPDGTQIAFESSTSDFQDVLVMDADGSNIRQLIPDGTGSIYMPAWSPLGDLIAFVRAGTGTGNLGLFVVNPDGSSELKLTGDANFSPSNPAWSPDGRLIAFNAVSIVTNTQDLFTIGVDGSDLGTFHLLPDIETNPSFSPDGQKVVFSARTTQGFEILIHDSRDASSTDQQQITNNGVDDTDPDWRPTP